MFQGLSADGKYYIIAILPINQPSLQADEKPGSQPPAGGVVFPGFDDPGADMAAYYNQIADMLDVTQPGAFTPGLDKLDAMIQSLTTGE